VLGTPETVRLFALRSVVVGHDIDGDRRVLIVVAESLLATGDLDTGDRQLTVADSCAALPLIP